MVLFIPLTCKDFIPIKLQFTWAYFKHAKKETKTCKKNPNSYKLFPSLHFKFLFENRNAVLFCDKDALHKHQYATFSYTAESFFRKSNVKQHISIENMATTFSGEKI